MAATTQVALPARTVTPLALWHLLSLDAPTVAVLWTAFLARTSHVPLPASAPLAMGLAVWILYAADRLLDTRHLHATNFCPEDELEERHLFHHRHRRAFLTAIVVCALTLAALLPRFDPRTLRLYLVEGAALVAWFLILHTSRAAHRLPKEIAVGLFFSAAVFIPTIARQPAPQPAHLADALLFAALCSLNCLFIYKWEHGPPEQGSVRQPHPTTRFALQYLPAVALALAALALVLVRVLVSPFPAACALASGLLLLLHRNRLRFGPTTLRAAADLALLTPILWLPFLR